MARGYLGRPDLTRQRFVRLADGTRAYCTGDIARRLPSGALAFISRADDQVKIVGHRIEPAEIAQALEEHPGVRQTAVIARSRPGRHDKELCAYVIWSHILRDQLDVDQAPFWACVQEGTKPDRGAPEPPAGALPADLVHLLLTRVHLSEAEVAAMSNGQ